MGDIHDDLREVMGLLSVATKGEWFSESMRSDMGWNYFQLRSGENMPFLDTLNSEMAMISTEGDEDGSYSYDETGLHDTRAIAAAVNFLRQHGPALLARQEGEWSPIESAPKDGTVILVWGEFAGEIGGPYGEPLDIGVASWQGGRTDYPGYDWRAENTDAYAGWWKPTHWRPRPAPPEASSGGGG